MSPRPTTIHQAGAGRLYGVLSAVCPEDLLVVPEPAVQIDPQTEFDPDLVVVPLDEVGDAKFTAPPLNRRKTAYENFGVQSYWIVDPDPARPEVTVFELRDGHYAPTATSTQPITVAHPFEVTIVPASLTKGLSR